MNTTNQVAIDSIVTTLRHQISQPLSTINNYASASVLLIQQFRSQPAESCEPVLQQLEAWLSEISLAARKAGEIVRPSDR